MRVLMIGDVVGRPGRECVRDLLPRLKENYRVDFTIANGENLAGGVGCNESTASEIFKTGVDVLTMGNHVWDRKEALTYIAREKKIIRPLNYPPGTPGAGSGVFQAGDCKLAVINLSGRVFLPPLDCPFRAAAAETERLRAITPLIIVDFHAEATSEKIALGYYLDGRVSAVLGTHTHVQTADERILPAGTAYITDVGMTGPYESVLGVKPENVIARFTSQLPVRFEVAAGEEKQLNGVVVEIDTGSGLARSITRINEVYG